MTEAGGASTQAGIFYQNSVAALYLAELLQLDAAPAHERVVDVRVEAPSDVDDVVVGYADGHRHYLTAKLSVRVGDDAWQAIWRSIRSQAAAIQHRPDDRITIVVAEGNSAARNLRELCKRATTALDPSELAQRLNSEQSALLAKVGDDSDDEAARFELVRRIDVWLLPEEDIEQEFARRRLGGGGGAPPARLLSVLRDLAGGHARVRTLFRAPALRRRLAEEQPGILVAEPTEWGLAAYRDTVVRKACIEVPGTGVSGHAADMLVWPRARDFERARPTDFEDELLPDRADPLRSAVDLKAFPSEQLHRCIIVAGPGHGKSALLSALAGRLASGPVTPALVPLASWAASHTGLADFLAGQVNRELDVRVGWRRLAEQGLVALLLDGLDEVRSSERAPLLKRLGDFSARYPHVPWLLTVRDPAVLTGATEARVLEILPLSDEDIVLFADAMKASCPKLDGWELVRRLDSYPDLKRLARIPLFLAIMLATVAEADALPASRADLIERYLKTLFAPHEHKPIDGTPASATLLRAVAARLAFERLELGEIGASEREVQAVVAAEAPDKRDVDSIMTALTVNGILRRQSSIRLQFPFPIVQEYLAAAYIVEHAAETLPSRIDDAIHRPWAQVLQFSLELHPAPTPIVRAMLDRSDDAFCTGLRLVARCVVNGAKVDPVLRAEVGDRLVTYWIHAHYPARQRVGQLILDGFARPISASLRRALHNPWLLNDGGGEIISRANDRTLTLNVLDRLLRRPLDRFSLYHPLKPALSAIGDEAFERIMEEIAGEKLDDVESEGLDDLLSHFASGTVARERALAAARDRRLPLNVRLNCYTIAGRPIEPEASSMAADLLRGNEPHLSHGIQIIALAQNPERLFLELVRDVSIPETHRRELAARLTNVFSDAQERDCIIARCRRDPEISSEIVAVAMLHAARFGDREAFAALVEMLPTLSSLVAQQVISLFGHHPGRTLAERAAALVEARVTTGTEAVTFAHSAETGMLYVYDMDLGFGGGLHDASPHAGTATWAQLLEAWSDRSDLSDTQRMGILTAAARLGAIRAQTRLGEIVLAIEDPDAPRYYEDDDYGHTMRSAVSEFRRRRPLIPLEVAERFARAKRPNVPYEGISAIAAHGDRAALDLLITLHSELSDWGARDTLESTIETLSAKLDLVIRRSNGALVINDQEGAGRTDCVTEQT
jgi:hypothetical protein